MTRSARTPRGVLALAANVLVLACGDSPSGPSGPALRAEIVSGDMQRGLAGHALREPVVFRVVGPGGSPRPGVAVSPAVPEGSGSVVLSGAVRGVLLLALPEPFSSRGLAVLQEWAAPGASVPIHPVDGGETDVPLDLEISVSDGPFEERRAVVEEHLAVQREVLARPTRSATSCPCPTGTWGSCIPIPPARRSPTARSSGCTSTSAPP